MLRHLYASLLIRHGESVKTVQDRLGHSSAAVTLDTYSHMWPDADDTTRAAVELHSAIEIVRTLSGLRTGCERVRAGQAASTGAPERFIA